MSNNFYMTHHSPVGALSSLVFGKLGMPASIDIQSPLVKDSADLLVGYTDFREVYSLPFSSEAKQQQENQLDLHGEGNKENQANDKKKSVKYFEANEIVRTINAGVDTFQAGKITFSTYTPHLPISDPEKAEISAIECLPAIVLTLEIDNTDSTEEITGFIGLKYNDACKIFSVENVYPDLRGCGFKNDWLFVSDNTEDIYTMAVRPFVENLLRKRPVLHETGPSLMCIDVKPGQKKTITAVFASYTYGYATNGIKTKYHYSKYFEDCYAVSKFALANKETLICKAIQLADETKSNFNDARKAEIFAQSVRAYYASTELLIDDDENVYYNVGEGAYVWRNTLDLSADHLAWELKRNPWVVRNIMDMYLDRYYYYDNVKFDDGTVHPGGISFTHDMGTFCTYSKAHQSAYERKDVDDVTCYFYMTTEELLNGIYCIGGYAIKTKDIDWIKKRKDKISDLMTSLENRDDYLPQRRNGIIKGISDKCGDNCIESTTYDALDHALMSSVGNIYIAVKTLGSLIIMEELATLVEDANLKARASAMLKKLEKSFALFKRPNSNALFANVLEKSENKVIAAIEPLAVIKYLGVHLEEKIPHVKQLLLKHVQECLVDGQSICSVTGGLKLSSTSNTTWVSKVILCLHILENEFNYNLSDIDNLLQQTYIWCTDCAAEQTVSDQVFVQIPKVIGGLYYPRIITSAFWLD